MADLAHEGARVVVARGGSGGRGNKRYATATRQAPRTAQVGLDGEERTLELRLKLLSDAALLGFPNAGKSSLLNRISNARPKVADYPFTTIEPQLGTVEADDGSQLTVADVPGLLEGASQGVGLGHEFLAHLERARALLHIVAVEPGDDVLADCRARFATIHHELVLHGEGLASLPQLVVLNKLDLLPPADGEALVAAFTDAIREGGGEADGQVLRDDDGEPRVLGISCATGQGIAALRGALFASLAPIAAPAPDPIGETELADFLVYRPHAGARAWRLLRDDGILRVTGREIEQAVARHDVETPGRRGGPRGRDRPPRPLERAPPRRRTLGRRGRGRRPSLHVRPAASTRAGGRGAPTRTPSGERRSSPRIGVFGGLFNPPHIGHLSLCQEAAWQLGLDRVGARADGSPVAPRGAARVARDAPSPGAGSGARQPDVHGLAPRDRSHRPVVHRRHAARALASLPGLEPAPPDRRRSARRAGHVARGAVASSSSPGSQSPCGPGSTSPEPATPNLDWIEMPQIGVSSSLVRDRVRDGRPIRYLVPDAVRELIEAEGLYREIVPGGERAD